MAYRRLAAQSDWALLLGPEGAELADNSDAATLTEGLLSDKSQMRRYGDKLFVVFPVRKSDAGDIAVWHLWILPTPPEMAALPARVEELRGLSRGLEAAMIKGEAGQTLALANDIDPLPLLLARIAPFGRPSRGVLLKSMADAIVQSGLARGATIAFCPQGTRRAPRRAFRFSHQETLKYRDEYRYVMSSRRTPDVVHTEIADRASDWDVGSFADMQDATRIGLCLPPQQEAGLGFVLLDPVANVDVKHMGAALVKLADFYNATRRGGRDTGALSRRFLRRGAMALAVIALVTWLVLPAPMRVTATVLTEPAISLVEALPEDAFLRQVNVRPGEPVEQGDVVATFSSISLDEQLADAQLRLAIEELTAQAALADNDYGAFALAESRVLLETERLGQIERRRDRLVITAQSSGRVISAVSNAGMGSFMSLGTQVMLVQPDAQFQISLDLASLDAPPITQGQTGSVWFRGMTGERFEFEVLQPAVAVRDEQTGNTRLVARGQLTDGPQDRLIVGLSGFAKVEIGRAPRAQVLSRYIAEYMREKLWLYLNIQI
jgi:hypothetical protein